MRTTGIGVIGCGMVSHAYLGTIARAPELELKSLASRTGVSAQAQASRYGGTATSVEAMLADPAVEVVVNLAPPTTHHEIGRRVLCAGKHLYSEKPFAIRLDEAEDLLALALARGLAIGCAPDTFLGDGHQAVRRLIDDGAIGRVTGGSIAFGSRGMESWHPDPAFFYAAGGGPLLDIGPYYVTQLVNLLGPVVQVIAIGTRPGETRTITSPDRARETIAVTVPTSVNGAMLFANGANVALSMSWDVAAHGRHPIELYGSDGALQAPDPNQFGGMIRLNDGLGRWTSVGTKGSSPRVDSAMLAKAMQELARGIDPVAGGPIGADTALGFGDLRGLGLLDLASAVRERRSPRASGQLATHVLEVLLALQSSAEGQGRISIRSTVDRPAPMPFGDPS